MDTYNIVRHFFNDDVQSVVIATDVTLAEAQAHCQDPETSSSSCMSDASIAVTDEFGP